MTHSGAILAIDAPGIVRVGSAYVLPSDNALFKTEFCFIQAYSGTHTHRYLYIHI